MQSGKLVEGTPSLRLIYYSYRSGGKLKFEKIKESFEQILEIFIANPNFLKLCSRRLLINTRKIVRNCNITGFV